MAEDQYNLLHGHSNSTFDHNYIGGGSQTSSEITSTDNRVALNLRKSDSLWELMEAKIMNLKQKEELTRNRHNKALSSSSASGSSSSEKQKASNFAISSLRIGSWERRSSHEGELIGKVYFAKRRLVWEVLDGPLKSKFEMQWDDITAIRISRDQNNISLVVLDIQLRQPPAMFKETPPQPKKHTNWEPSESLNFTGGQATYVRRHRVTFHPGVFERHYEQLLKVDNRLFDLSQKPFPDHESHYFPIQHPIPRQHPHPHPPPIAQYSNPLTIADRMNNQFMMPQTQPCFPQISMPQTQPCFPQIRMPQARPYLPQMNMPLPSGLPATTRPCNFPDYVNNAQDDLMDFANDFPLSEDCFQITDNNMQTLDGFQTEHVELLPYPESNIILDHDCQTEPVERPPYPEAALGSIPITFLPEAADGGGYI